MTQTFKHAVIACHPAEDSFTMTVARKYAEVVRTHSDEVVFRDLYRMGFDPVLKDEERHGHPAADVVGEWAQLGKTDVFVLVYPVWFGAPPALLKGYIDRVFGAGRMLGKDGGSSAAEQLRSRKFVSLTSSGWDLAWLSEKGVFNSLRSVFDRYLADVFHLAETSRYHFDGINDDMGAKEAEAHFREVERAAGEVLGRLHVTPPDLHPNRR